MYSGPGMVISPYIIYTGSTALDVRKATMWSPNGTPLSVYVRCTPGIPNDVPAAPFTVAKQADVDAASFVK